MIYPQIPKFFYRELFTQLLQFFTERMDRDYYNHGENNLFHDVMTFIVTLTKDFESFLKFYDIERRLM